MPDATLPLLKPELYALGASHIPVLLGGRCECGFVFFPMQTFGCERCGRNGTALIPFSLTGRGRLRAVATVHVHADDKRKAPFVVGAIELDEGPVVRTLLEGISAERNFAGARVEAVLIAVDTQPGAQALDLRFRRVTP